MPRTQGNPWICPLGRFRILAIFCAPGEVAGLGHSIFLVFFLGARTKKKKAEAKKTGRKKERAKKKRKMRTLKTGGVTRPRAYPNDTFRYEQPRQNISFPRRFGPDFPPEQGRGVASPGAISPGEQDLAMHAWASKNRYDAQMYNPNIFLRPTAMPEPYSQSLYQTPYDQTQNLISTGTLVNPYSGEVLECFENQLPPPTTSKGVLLKSQLEQPNPRLVQLQQFNPHCPGPRRCEQPGEVFRPVSLRGGPPPLGSTPIDREVVKQQREIVARDIFNNMDGTPAVPISMYGEQPWGFRGLQPMFQFMPFVPATQELDLQGRMLTPDPMPTDLRKREQFTGDSYSRKAHVSTEYYGAPSNLINGVEAVMSVPVSAEHFSCGGPHRNDALLMGYIAPAQLPFTGGTALQPTLRLNPFSHDTAFPLGAPADSAAGNLVLNPSLPASFSSGGTLPVSAPQLPGTGGIATNPNPLVSSSSSSLALPVGAPGLPGAAVGPVITTNVPSSSYSVSLPVNAPQLAQTGNIILPLTPRTSAALGGFTFPSNAAASIFGVGPIVAQTTLHDTQNSPLVCPVVGAPAMPSTGSLALVPANVRREERTSSVPVGEPTLPSAGSLVVAQGNVPGVQSSVWTFPTGGVSSAEGSSPLVSQTGLLLPASAPSTLPVAAGSHTSGNVLVGQQTISSNNTMNLSFPVSETPALPQTGGVLLAQHSTPLQNQPPGSLPTFGPSLPQGNILTAQQQLVSARASLGCGPVAGLALEGQGNLAHSDNLKQTAQETGSFPMSAAGAGEAGALMTAQHDLAKQSEDSHTLPTGPLASAEPQTYVQLDKSARLNQRVWNPINAFISGPNGGAFGLPVPLGEWHSRQARDLQQMAYVTQNSKLIDGDSSVRVMHIPRRRDRSRPQQNRAAMGNLETTTSRAQIPVAPSARLTNRALQ